MVRIQNISNNIRKYIRINTNDSNNNRLNFIKNMNKYDEVKPVVQKAATLWKLKEEDVIGNRRLRDNVMCRNAVANVLYGDFSKTDIGKFLNKNHSTIINSINNSYLLLTYEKDKYDKLLNFYGNYRRDVLKKEKNIKPELFSNYVYKNLCQDCYRLKKCKKYCKKAINVQAALAAGYQLNKLNKR